MLDKEDPFWNAHLPPNGWGYKCRYNFLTKSRLERYRKDGVPDMTSVKPGVGRPTKSKPIQEKRPEIRYRTWVNKRSGEILRVPEGVDPAFAWNPGRTGADVALFGEYLKKSREQFPKRWEALAGAMMHNTVRKEHWTSFARRALASRVSGENAAAIGFLSEKVRRFVEKQGLKPADGTVGIEARLLSGPKARRHEDEGNALSAEEWLGLPDILLNPDRVLWDRTNGTVLYVRFDGRETVKVAVKPDWTNSKQGTIIKYASVRSAFKVDMKSLEQFEVLK